MAPIGSFALYNCFLCKSLKCIYLYGKTLSTVSSNAFSCAPASVMTLSIYQSETFGDLNASKGTKIDEYIPPTLIFTKLIAFMELNIFSNTFTQPSTFTELLSSGAAFTNTFILTQSL